MTNRSEVDIVRLLGPLLGYNTEYIHTWLNSDNQHLRQKPIKLCQTEEGIDKVIDYLHRMRRL